MKPAVRTSTVIALWGLLLIGLCTPGAASELTPGDSLPVASDARIAGDVTRTRFVMDLSKRIDISAFTLADPDRVVIDLPQVMFELPARAGESGRGLVKAFRFGLIMQGAARIVLDVTGPVRVDRAFVLEPAESQPARLVVDLVATDRDSYLHNIAIENAGRHHETVAEKPERGASGPNDDPRPLIVLDPGHGGLDNGTRSANGNDEKKIVLDFALELRDKLLATNKYRVLMTRSDDRYVALSDRVALGRKNQASLFISIHADALPNHDSEARGATIYTLSDTASDAEAARLAEDENRSDAIAGFDLTDKSDDVADILIDLTQRETRTFSTSFARTLMAGLKTATRLRKHPLKSAGFRVLKAPDVPSVLVELGFVSNSEDVRSMISEAWRQRTTGSVVDAIGAYFATRVAGTGSSPGAN